MGNKMIRQKEMEIEDHLEAVKSEKAKSTSLQNEMAQMRIVMESTTAELQKEKENNDIKNNTIDALTVKVSKITEEIMRMKKENDDTIEELELSKSVAEDELLSQEKFLKE